MEGLRAAFHKTGYNLPETDVHVFLDEDDAVKVVRHQLTGDDLDLSAALLTCAERLLYCPLFVKSGDIIPAAQNGYA
jgi:hypothetical protein